MNRMAVRIKSESLSEMRRNTQQALQTVAQYLQQRQHHHRSRPGPLAPPRRDYPPRRRQLPHEGPDPKLNRNPFHSGRGAGSQPAGFLFARPSQTSGNFKPAVFHHFHAAARDLVRAGQVLKMEVLDQVIVGNPSHCSLRELGYFST